jgi:hypothetical protein
MKPVDPVLHDRVRIGSCQGHRPTASNGGETLVRGFHDWRVDVASDVVPVI